jgi:hypothetical protein
MFSFSFTTFVSKMYPRTHTIFLKGEAFTVATTVTGGIRFLMRRDSCVTPSGI